MATLFAWFYGIYNVDRCINCMHHYPPSFITLLLYKSNIWMLLRLNIKHTQTLQWPISEYTAWPLTQTGKLNEYLFYYYTIISRQFNVIVTMNIRARLMHFKVINRQPRWICPPRPELTMRHILYKLFWLSDGGRSNRTEDHGKDHMIAV